MPSKTLLNFIKNKRVHFIGIGGIGMSALARWFLTQGWAVSGSDLAQSGITQELAKEGVEVKIGHKKDNLLETRDRRQEMGIGLVIYNNAIKRDNPELITAQEFDIPTFSYPQAVGELTRVYKTVAIAGAHGKSTTTALVSLILTKAGLDPTIIIGTKLKELKGQNFRIGKSGWLVLEADEYAAAFLNYSPTFAIITNIDQEHLDFYKNFSNVKKSFLNFIGRIQSGGSVVINADNKNLLKLKSKIGKICKLKNVKVVWYSIKKPFQYKDIVPPRRDDVQVLISRIRDSLKLYGEHNVSNALGAYTLAKKLEISDKIIFDVFKAYTGSWRRQEYKGKTRLEIRNSKLEIIVYDDYAHHPTEIKATLKGFRGRYPKKYLICVFQPHQAERLKLLFNDFTKSFKDADQVVILPSYQVSGRDSVDPKSKIQNPKNLVKKDARSLAGKIGAIYLENPKNILRRTLIKIIRNLKLKIKNSPQHYVVVMMGAGDIVQYTKLLLSKK